MEQKVGLRSTFAIRIDPEHNIINRMVVAPRVLAEVYRLHHVPLPAITLQALLKRGPKAPPAAVIARLREDPSELQKVRDPAGSSLHQLVLTMRLVMYGCNSGRSSMRP